MGYARINRRTDGRSVSLLCILWLFPWTICLPICTSVLFFLSIFEFPLASFTAMVVDQEKTPNQPSELLLLEIVKKGMQDGNIISKETIEEILLIKAIVPILKFKVSWTVISPV